MVSVDNLQQIKAHIKEEVVRVVEEAHVVETRIHVFLQQNFRENFNVMNVFKHIL